LDINTAEGHVACFFRI